MCVCVCWMANVSPSLSPRSLVSTFRHYVTGEKRGKVREVRRPPFNQRAGSRGYSLVCHGDPRKMRLTGTQRHLLSVYLCDS